MSKYETICYQTDGSKLVGELSKVVYPRNVNEVSGIIRGTESDIVPRGSGSNLVGSCIPNNSIVVDMKKMNKVTDFDSKKRSVFSESGVTIKEINEKLESVGFEFPIKTDDIRTIGGMIAMNSISDFGIYGNIRDWIEEMEIVNGRGEIVSIGKNDISDVCGLEGITGIITKVKLKIIPLVKRSSSILQRDDKEEMLVMIRRLNLESDIAMMNLYPPKLSKLIGFPEKYNLIIIFNSDRGKIKGDKYNELLKRIKKVKDYLVNEGYYYSEDPMFYQDKIKEFILFLEERKIIYFGELTLGIIYPYFKVQNEIKEELRKVVRRLQGKYGKYGIGLKRKELIDPIKKKLIQRVKLRYDPFGKLNNGKLIDFESVRDKGKIGSKIISKRMNGGKIESRIEPLKDLGRKVNFNETEIINQIDSHIEDNDKIKTKEKIVKLNRKTAEVIDDLTEISEMSEISEGNEIIKTDKEVNENDKMEEIGRTTLTDNLDRKSFSEKTETEFKKTFRSDNKSVSKNNDEDRKFENVSE